MSEILLIRHAETVSQGLILAGRMAGVQLSEGGERQARRLARRLRGEEIAAVYCSPLERARATAAAIGRPVRIHAAFHEIDYGEWTGRTIRDLEDDPRWRAWNERRGTAGVPGGESMAEVQRRAVRGMESLRASHPEGRIAVVTHGDIIRAAVLFYSGISLDCIHQIDAPPASVSRFLFRSGARRLKIRHSRQAGVEGEFFSQLLRFDGRAIAVGRT